MFSHVLVRLCVFTAAWTLTTGAGLAQSKVAIINLQRAVLESAEIKKASADLEARYKPRQQKVEALQQELQGIQKQLQDPKLTPQAQQELNVTGTRRQRELQRLVEDLQGDVERERNEILTKSTQQMQEVVKKLAEEKGIDMVVDVNNTIYFKPALEITTEAIAAYDKAYPPK